MRLVLIVLLLLSPAAIAKEKKKKLKTHPARVDALVARINHDSPDQALSGFGKKAKKRNKILYQLERGRVYQICGDHEKSKAAFEKALLFIKEKEDRAVVSASKIAANTGAAVVNDKMMPYKGYGYEKVLIHHYQSINYLALGDVAGSSVEVRLANQRQKEEMDRYLRDLEKAEEKARKELEKSEKKDLKKVDEAQAKQAEAETVEAEAAEAEAAEEPKKKRGFRSFTKKMLGGKKTSDKKKGEGKGRAGPTNWSEIRTLISQGYDKKHADLDEIAGLVKNSFQNAATFYFSGIHYESQNELDDAYIDYKRALEIDPDNAYVIRDTMRLAKKLGRSDELRRLQSDYPAFVGAQESLSDATLVVFFEDGLAPQKQQVKMSIPLAGQLISIASPTYPSKRENTSPLKISNGQFLGKTEPICDIQVLAAKALKEENPLRVARQITRMITKGGMTKVLENNAGFLGTIAGGAYGRATENADLRSWLTLPGNIQVARFPIQSGPQQINLKQTGGVNQTVTIEPAAGQIVILQIIRVNGKTFLNPIHMKNQGA